MEKPIPADIGTAVLVSKTAKDLCEDRETGIISIDQGGVHMAEFMFHQLFSTWHTEPREDEYVYHVHKVSGVRVYCLSWKGGERP